MRNEPIEVHMIDAHAIDRRQLLASIVASAFAGSLPASAIAGPALERATPLFGQLIDLLRTDGYAIAKLNDGGEIRFWLADRSDIISMEIMSLGDDETPDVVAILEQAAAIKKAVLL